MDTIYYILYPGAKAPIPADPSAGGDTPIRAFRLCEPMIVASAAGQLVFPPINFSLQWDGVNVFVKLPIADEWILLNKIFLPDYVDFWHSFAPVEARESMPAFLEAFPERGIVQIWSGLVAVTPPGKSLWIRGPINRPKKPLFEILECIIEAEWWVGPLFTNLRFSKTDTPVTFSQNDPFLQCITIPTIDQKVARASFTTIELSDNRISQLWPLYIENSIRRNTEHPGSYRRRARTNKLNDP